MGPGLQNVGSGAKKPRPRDLRNRAVEPATVRGKWTVAAFSEKPQSCDLRNRTVAPATVWSRLYLRNRAVAFATAWGWEQRLRVLRNRSHVT